MDVRAGREFLAIPGPTTMPDEVLRAMHRPALDIYSPAMVELTDEPAARSLDRCSPPRAAATSTSPTATARGKRRSPTCCRAATRCWCWRADASRSAGAQRAAAMGIEVEVLKGDWQPRGAARRGRGAAAGRHRPRDQGDPRRAGRHGVGRGQRHPRHRRRRSSAAGHDALFMVDAVASLGCMPFEMDAWGIDVAMSGSQKGLMAPPGLGIRRRQRPRARRSTRRADLRTPYWDWTEREGAEHYKKYSGTAPVHLLFALRRALDLLFAEGLDAARSAPPAARRGGAPRASACGRKAACSASTSREPAERSDTVTTVLMTGARSAARCRRYCSENCGVILGTGIGDLSGQGVPHRAYGPRQRADDPRHARRRSRWR